MRDRIVFFILGLIIGAIIAYFVFDYLYIPTGILQTIPQ